jgi:multidrug efflux pump subunit AcrA (membrane-fusion protein)
VTAPSGPSRGFIKTILLTALILAGGIAGLFAWINATDSDQSTAGNDLTFAVIEGEFISSINEPGDVLSSSNVEVRCRVRERGGTPILEIVDEGTQVEVGDFLVQLDDTDYRDELVEQKIQVASDRAAVIQAQSDLATAERTLAEFENGQFAQEVATLEAELALAEETHRRALEYRKYSANLARKGYINKAQLEADEFAVLKAEAEVDLARSKLNVLENFSKERMRAELVAEIEKQKANLEASQFTEELSRQRQAYYEEQVAACRITAPVAGQVVYASDIEGRGESGIVIEEGVNVLEGQAIIRLPDPENMQVVARVNDSKINLVQAGQPAIIRLDTATGVEIAGKVRKVADFPLPRRWEQAPIEYEVFIDITERNEMVRTGLRAKAEVFVERIDKAIQAPVSSVIQRGDRYFVVVASGVQREMREVKLGTNNESLVVIESGLKPGERVLVDPDDYRDAEVPAADTST